MRRLLLLKLLCFLAVAAQAQGGERFAGNTDTVFVRGLVERPFMLVAGQKTDLPFVPVPPQVLTHASGDVRKKFGASRGVLLRELLNRAKTNIGHKERGKYLLVVTAADSMQVLFAYNELFYGPAAQGAYLLAADGVDGMEGAGRFTVLCTSDLATAPRYVKWVRSIELRKIEAAP